jgi:hypothetical protein
MDPRTWFKGSVAALGTLAGRPFALPASTPAEPPVPRTAFRHRGYLGWITDLATQPDPQADWPSMRLDEPLLEDYRRTFDLLPRLGFNEVVIWGLYVSRAWPVDLPRSVPPERGARVERLIELAHQRGLRVYSGLGLYSWGFDQIIQAHPQLSRGNPQVMCACEPEAWEWMRRVIDFVFERFPIDGVSMQSADQGRCPCEACRRYGEAEYHALLNVRAAEYIRSRWPDRTIGVNSWGMNFHDPANLPFLVQMSRAIDYLIDVHNTAGRSDPGYRRTLIQSLECAFGTLGGPQVEPPQHWERDRWFLPTLRRVGEHLQQLFQEGGRACEYFFHILANPGDEVSLWLAGKTLADPQTSWEKHLQDSVAEVFEVDRASVQEALAQLFLQAEEAYFQYLPAEFCGTLSLEPLVSNRPGEPIYLRQQLSPEQQAAYAQDLRRLRERAWQLLPEVPRREKMQAVLRCLDRVIADLAPL